MCLVGAIQEEELYYDDDNDLLSSSSLPQILLLSSDTAFGTITNHNTVSIDEKN
jgi:hypothetical protein